MRSGVPSAQGGFQPPCAKPRGRWNCPAGAVGDRRGWRVEAAPSGEAGAVGLRRRGEVGAVRRHRWSRRRGYGWMAVRAGKVAVRGTAGTVPLAGSGGAYTCGGTLEERRKDVAWG